MRIRKLLPWLNEKIQNDYEHDSGDMYYKECEISSRANPAISGSQKNIIKIITDEPMSQSEEDALRFEGYSIKLAEIIAYSTPQFAVGIFGGWGTGKTTLMRMIEKQLKIRDNGDILVVWFDAWKYENEKYLAVVPFIRTIETEVENRVREESKADRLRQVGINNAERWNKVRKGLEKTLNAFIESTNLSLGIGSYGSVGEINLSKFRDTLKADGHPIEINNEHIYYHHKHVTDYLKNALDELRHSKIGKILILGL